QPEEARQPIRWLGGRRLGPRPLGEVRRVEEHEPEDDRDRRRGGDPGQERADERADRRGDLEEHPDADIRVPLLDVGRGRPRGGRDDRDQRGADRVADVDAEPEREQGRDDDAPAEPGERPQEAGGEGAEPDEEAELEDGNRHDRAIVVSRSRGGRRAGSGWSVPESPLLYAIRAWRRDRAPAPRRPARRRDARASRHAFRTAGLLRPGSRAMTRRLTGPRRTAAARRDGPQARRGSGIGTPSTSSGRR